eukprot:359501-Chlamydomonas_euryale.AAC.1
MSASLLANAHARRHRQRAWGSREAAADAPLCAAVPHTRRLGLHAALRSQALRGATARAAPRCRERPGHG